VGDLTIAARLWEADQLRTQASVAAVFPTDRRARGAPVPPHFHQTGRRVPPNHEKRGGVARPALSERGPLGHTPVTIARDRIWRMSQRSLAVVRRRSGPRHVLESRGWLSAFICVICGFSVCGRLCVSLCVLCASVV